MSTNAVGVELDAHRLGVEPIEIELDFKYALLAIDLKLHLAETQRGPSLVQRMPPIEDIHAHFALIGSPLKVG